MVGVAAALTLTPIPGDRAQADSPGSSRDIPEQMVLIPGGLATIGTDPAELNQLVEMGREVPHMDSTHATWWFGDETPQHEVSVAPFYMDAHEVTNAEFAAFVEATGYEAEGDWRKYAGEGREQHPVVNVTWHDANAYAEWAGKRLPTEAEWEWAARAGSDARWFPWGDTPDPDRANWRQEGESFFQGLGRMMFGRRIHTTPVGSYEPNGFGLYDMVGNAAEWCADPYAPYPGFALETWVFTRHGPYDKDEAPLQGRVIRGGSWDSPNAVFVRITSRNVQAEDEASPRVGFRCVRSLEE